MTTLAIITLVLIGLTVYVYAGYPLLIAIWGRIRPHQYRRADITPRLSLIIAAYNEEGVIAEKLRNSLALDYPSEMLEIIVVADGSRDATAHIARDFEKDGVRVMHSPERRGKSAALNRAVAAASGEIVVFSDANAFYEADALAKLARNFADPEVGAVSGNKTVRRGSTSIADAEGFYWKYESFIKKQETLTGSTIGVVGEINAIRKALYPGIPEHIVNDDSYLCLAALRSGWRVVYEPAAVSFETPAQSMTEEAVRRRRITAGRYQQMFTPSLWMTLPATAIFKLVSHKYLRLMLPLLMIGALATNTIVVLAEDPPGLLVATFVAQLAAYLAAGAGMLLGGSRGAAKLPRAAYYVVSSNFAALGGLQHFLSGRATVLWQKADR
jgi:cellulose synthase/poly-beta-1,6-N-acetylglucosamine synthase-like glycosyltransferase